MTGKESHSNFSDLKITPYKKKRPQNQNFFLNSEVKYEARKECYEIFILYPFHKQLCVKGDFHAISVTFL